MQIEVRTFHNFIFFSVINDIIKWPKNENPLPVLWQKNIEFLFCCCPELPSEIIPIIFSKWVIVEERMNATKIIKEILSTDYLVTKKKMKN